MSYASPVLKDVCGCLPPFVTGLSGDFEYNASSLTFTATYDNDTSDDESTLTELSLPVEMQLSAKSEKRLTLLIDGQASAMGTLRWPISGILDARSETRFMGDYDGNGRLDVGDLDLLADEITGGRTTRCLMSIEIHPSTFVILKRG